MQWPKQILIYAQYTNGSGGISTWAHLMSQEFSRRGHKVILVAKYESPHPIKRSASIATSGHAVTHIFLEPAANQAATDISARVEKIDTILSGLDKDAIIIAAESPMLDDIFSCQITARSNFTIIAQLHFKAADILQPTEITFRKYRHAITAFQTLTEEDTHYMQQQGFKQTFTIANPVVKPLAMTPSHARQKTFILLARLVDEKGIEDAVRAWCMVAATHPDWSLNIYGDGPLKKSLQTLIATLSLTNNVTLMGLTTKPFAIISASYGVISSSLTEGMSMVILEAMAHGTPVIAYDSNPGTRDIITDMVDGLLVQTGNIPDLTTAILKLIEQTALHEKLSHGASRRAKDYSVESIADCWENLFDTLT